MLNELNSIPTLSEHPRTLALRWFNKALSIGRSKRLGARLLRRNRAMQSLQAAQLSSAQEHYAGLRHVPLDAIVGTENRAHEFDCEFYPLEDHVEARWASVMMARMSDISLPPVQLIQVGEVYYVRDGHHRISVARMLGQAEIDAQVIVWEAPCSLPCAS